MSTIFSHIRDKALEYYHNQKIPIRALLFADFRRQPSENERVFASYLLIAQTLVGQGSCLLDHKPEIDLNIIGENALDHISNLNPLSIAIVDSLYDGQKLLPSAVMTLGGRATDKAKTRARLVADHATQLVGIKNNERPKAILIGYVRNIASELIKRNFEVVITDRKEDVIGAVVNGITIQGPEINAKHIPESDVVVVTGMTLATNTLDGILETVKANRSQVVVYAQTGANLAREYLHYGASVVISEPFPCYDLDGETVIKIHYHPTFIQRDFDWPNLK